MEMDFEEADAYLTAFHAQMKHCDQIFVWDEVDGKKKAPRYGGQGV